MKLWDIQWLMLEMILVQEQIMVGSNDIYYWSIVWAEGCKWRKQFQRNTLMIIVCVCEIKVAFATFHKIISVTVAYFESSCVLYFLSLISKVLLIFLRQCVSKMWWSWEKAWPSWKRFKGKINVTVSAPAEEFFGGRHENNYSELSYPFWSYIYLKWQY